MLQSDRLGSGGFFMLSIIILANILNLVVASILFSNHDEDNPMPEDGKPMSKSNFEADDNHADGGDNDGDRYKYHHTNQTLSQGMRELIDIDETAELRWNSVVVKWSKHGPQQEMSGHKMNDIRGKRSVSWRSDSAITAATAVSKTRTDCGGKVRSVLLHDDLITNKTTGSQHNGNKRIYNGHLAKAGDFPWVALIKIFSSLFESSLCSGSIISEWLIMTSAHCVSSCNNGKPKLVDPNMISALVGRNEISWWALNLAPSDVLFRAIIAPAHTDPCNPRIESDYVFLVASERMKMRTDASDNQNSLARVCLPDSENMQLDNKRAIIVGWGETNVGGGRSNELRWGEVTIKTEKFCKARQPDLDPNRTLCALGKFGGCQGDSGGPLMIKDSSGRWVQIGIYSAFVGNGGKCGPHLIMLFNKISPFWRWAIDALDIAELIKVKFP